MGFNSNVRHGVGNTRCIFSYSDNGGNDLVAAINPLLTADANPVLCKMIPSTSAELKTAFEEEPTKFFIALHQLIGFQFLKWLTCLGLIKNYEYMGYNIGGVMEKE